MRKVITGSLNGNAYQFEEEAFLAVQAYLRNAEARFAANPDRAEIMADLEQAVADKCDTFLGKHKTVISVAEARQMLREIGPVSGNTSDFTDTTATVDQAAAAPTATAIPRRRRLYRLTNEGMMGGVCAGLAAYIDVDVVWVRLGYVLLAISTGIWFLIWLTQLFITPKAVTPEEIAAAHGDPLTAREVIDRAKQGGRAAAAGLNDAAQNLRDAFGR